MEVDRKIHGGTCQKGLGIVYFTARARLHEQPYHGLLYQVLRVLRGRPPAPKQLLELV